MNDQIICDFDGTISLEDVTDVLLDRFAPKTWQAVERDWEEGRITSAECLSRQVSLIRATPEELDTFSRNIKLDPFFPLFVSKAVSLGVEINIVSDGLDRLILQALKHHNLDRLSVFSNHLVHDGGDQWRVAFPNQKTQCHDGMGTCKCSFVKSNTLFLIGDGASDFCVAQKVRQVMAKPMLAQHCREQDIAYIPISNFQDALLFLEQMAASLT